MIHQDIVGRGGGMWLRSNNWNKLFFCLPQLNVLYWDIWCFQQCIWSFALKRLPSQQFITFYSQPEDFYAPGRSFYLPTTFFSNNLQDFNEFYNTIYNIFYYFFLNIDPWNCICSRDSAFQFSMHWAHE